MAEYVRIYCNEQAVKDSRHKHDNREQLGKCFAEKLAGRWYCCCCGKPVRVVEW